MKESCVERVCLSYSYRDPLASRAAKEARLLWHYRACIPTFVMHNLRRRYQRSLLGFFWSLLNPLATMTIMTVVFSLFFHRQPQDFALYIFSGLLPWTFISTTLTSGCGSIVESETYLKKLPVSKLIFPVVLVATESCNFALSLSALALFGALFGLDFHTTVLAVPLALSTTVAFTFGITLLLSVSTVYFRDIAHIVAVALSGIFYLTPVLYPLTAIPENMRSWFLLNPFYHLLNQFHALIAEGRLPRAEEWSVAVALSAVALALGVSFYLLKERDIVYRI